MSTPPRQPKPTAYSELPNLKKRLAPGAKQNTYLQATNQLWIEGTPQTMTPMTLPKTGYIAPPASLPAGVFGQRYNVKGFGSTEFNVSPFQWSASASNGKSRKNRKNHKNLKNRKSRKSRKNRKNRK